VPVSAPESAAPPPPSGPDVPLGDLLRAGAELGGYKFLGNTALLFGLKLTTSGPSSRRPSHRSDTPKGLKRWAGQGCGGLAVPFLSKKSGSIFFPDPNKNPCLSPYPAPPPGVSAFIVQLSTILVPLLEAGLLRAPVPPITWVACLLSLSGVVAFAGEGLLAGNLGPPPQGPPPAW